MKKYLNHIKRIEQTLGLDDTKQNWLVNKLDDDVIEVTNVNTPDNSHKLTHAEFRRFKGELEGRIIEVEWKE